MSNTSTPLPLQPKSPLVLWNGVLVDGHNRYDICNRLKLPFKTIERAFENRSEVIEWIINNQFGRRNLNSYIRATLALRLGSEIAARAKINLKTSSGGKNPQPFQKSGKAVHTDKELAKLAGVSHDTIFKVNKIEEKGSEEVKKSLAKGEISINEAHKKIKAEETRHWKQETRIK